MVRTVISIEEQDKAWLDEKAAQEGVPMTELVRRAIRLLRQRENLSDQPLEELIKRTRGLFKGGDGLAWQRGLRDEW
jgi:hypothetical protein